MSDEESLSIPDAEGELLSFEEVKRDENVASIQDLRSRIKVLEEENLALRQNRDKRSPSRADDQITNYENDRDQTVPKRRYDDPSVAPTSRIAQTQEDAYRKVLDKQDATAMEYTPSMASSRGNPYPSHTAPFLPQTGRVNEYGQKESSAEVTLTSIIQNLLASNRAMEERLAKLEINEQYGSLQNRVSVCEKKMDSMIGRRDRFETKIREAVSVLSAQSQSKGRTFQAFIMSQTRLDKKGVDVRLDQFEKIFFASAQFSQETCEYTIPESGLYEFRVRWRQSGTGQIRVTIHWGEEKVSRLGQTSPENDVLCPVLRRYVEEGVKVRLSAMVMSGTPKLESCDFGGSFITSKHIVEVPL